MLIIKPEHTIKSTCFSFQQFPVHDNSARSIYHEFTVGKDLQTIANKNSPNNSGLFPINHSIAKLDAGYPIAKQMSVAVKRSTH
jgi:hypothetical protein